MVHHPTNECFVLKDKILALIDIGVLTLKSEQNKVIANTVTLKSGTFLKVTIQDGVALNPKVRMEVINLISEEQKAKDLVPITIKSGEIMWVQPDIVKNEQWESIKLKIKGTPCNVISLAVDNDIIIMASLNNSKEEKFAFATQPATVQPVDTRSGKQYL